jgi:hypothetical protein
MSAPTFEYDRGIATLTWRGEPPATFVFDRLREDRRSQELTAEVTYFAGLDGSRALLHRARLNLTATRSRTEVGKVLAARLPGADWESRLEVACWRVIDAVRAGRPAILLRDAEEPPGDGTLLAPLLIPDDPVILFGDGGTAKSYLGLALAASVHAGHPYADLPPSHRLRTAYLDFEWRAWPHRKRLRALCGEDELPDLVYIPCLAEGPLSAQVDRLRRILHEHGTEYVVIDSVALACAGPPEEASVSLDFFQALAQLEVGSCLLAHIPKGGDEDRPFGSTFWHNSARLTWFLKATQEPGQPRLDLALHNRKVNDGGRTHSFALHFEFGSATTIRRTDLHAIPELAGSLPLKERIAGALASGPRSVRDLAEQLDAEPTTVRRTLARGEGRRFTRTQDSAQDRWALLAHSEYE